MNYSFFVYTVCNMTPAGVCYANVVRFMAIQRARPPQGPSVLAMADPGEVEPIEK